MEPKLYVTLLANAGVLLEYEGTTMLLDGIFGQEGHPFSNLRPETWEKLLCGEPPFEKIDYLLVSHAHPDHFSPERIIEFLRKRPVKGIFLPDAPEVENSGLGAFLAERGIFAAVLSTETGHTSFRIAPEISLRGYSTRHLDKKFAQVPHLCYLLRFGRKAVLFTADVDYTQETFAPLREILLRAVFVNPLFFGALRRGRFFRGEWKAQTVCVYHVPFSGEDTMGMRPVLAREAAQWPPEKGEALVLCEPMQRLEL